MKLAFQRYGKVKKALIIRDPKTGKSKGYGFITFLTNTAYNSALSQTTYVEGRKADCHSILTKSDLKKKTKKDQIYKMFVGGLPHEATKADLQAYFCKFGRINECRVLYDGNTGNSRGFGFVLFQEEKSINNILERKRDHFILGKKVDCKVFQEKNEKKKSVEMNDKNEEGTKSKTEENSLENSENEEEKKSIKSSSKKDGEKQFEEEKEYFTLGTFNKKSPISEKKEELLIPKDFLFTRELKLSNIVDFGIEESLPIFDEKIDESPLVRPTSIEESHQPQNIRFNNSKFGKKNIGDFEDFSHFPRFKSKFENEVERFQEFGLRNCYYSPY